MVGRLRRRRSGCPGGLPLDDDGVMWGGEEDAEKKAAAEKATAEKKKAAEKKAAAEEKEVAEKNAAAECTYADEADAWQSNAKGHTCGVSCSTAPTRSLAASKAEPSTHATNTAVANGHVHIDADGVALATSARIRAGG